MAISKTTLKAILGIVEDYHLAFLADILGTDILESDEINRLVSKGLLPKDTVDLIQKAYEFGIVSGATKAVEMPEGMGIVQFMRYSEIAKPRLSYDEQAFVEQARQNAATYIRSLGNTFIKKAQAIIVEGDKKLRRSTMLKTRKVISSGISERRTVKEIAKSLRKALEGQKADFLKIAATEVNNALQEGRMHSIVKSATPGEDPLVFKRPHSDCCAFCKHLYLESDGVTPKLFRLSDLIGNGSNVGRKAGRPIAKSCGWKACVESTHPFCRCPLHYLPPGFTFDSKGSMVYKGRATKSEYREIA